MNANLGSWKKGLKKHHGKKYIKRPHEHWKIWFSNKNSLSVILMHIIYSIVVYAICAENFLFRFRAFDFKIENTPTKLDDFIKLNTKRVINHVPPNELIALYTRGWLRIKGFHFSISIAFLIAFPAVRNNAAFQ